MNASCACTASLLGTGRCRRMPEHRGRCGAVPKGRLRLRREGNLAMVRAVTLLRAAALSLGFGSRKLFEDLELVVEENERVGLIGVNGSGKSTLMMILSGAISPDAGQRQARRRASVPHLAQTTPLAGRAT